MNRTRTLHSGFTLLEIMLVVMIIALLASSAIYMMYGHIPRTQAVRVECDIASLEIQLLMYKNTAGFYPSTEQGLRALLVRPESEPKPRQWSRLLKKDMPRDPWQSDYHYVCPGTHNLDSYDLFSAGEDRQPGTSDDIGNWASGAQS